MVIRFDSGPPWPGNISEFVASFFFDVQPGASAASLALIERSPMTAFDGLVHVRVREHRVGTLAAQLQAHPVIVLTVARASPSAHSGFSLYD